MKNYELQTFDTNELKCFEKKNHLPKKNVEMHDLSHQKIRNYYSLNKKNKKMKIF